ncbi:monovalent cation/H(+) antiporter subunit G [Ammoniphilus sp. YIM 78166]|uniref:monovalent cation/H(+) antiporter subunit G n=1 Tax=Ammoniphilus sp. YIM 78166 TaxID=1644106 RepID=UPI001F0D866E|nr:monovalent cation/H(+) antiporter subunit G [Ammoniphilus sp. YIM 78166]
MSAIEIAKIVVGVLLLIGSLLSLLSTFGLLRLPDIYNRTHAATKAATLGTVSILVGAFIFFYAVDGIVSAKLLLGILFVFITAPVAGHMVGRAAYRTGVPLWEMSIKDDLKRDDMKRTKKLNKKAK